MVIEKIDETNRYLFERIEQTKDEDVESKTIDGLLTAYIHRGEAQLYIYGETIGILDLKAGEGFVLTPGTQYILDTKTSFEAFQVSSEVDTTKPIIEIIDDGYSRREEELTGPKHIENPKRVDKPWGHELWIMWTRDYHVMKQIGMFGGKQSSLQFHREKLETNYLIEGEADVIDGYQLDPQTPEEEVLKSSKGIDFNQYKENKKPGDFWTSQAGVVHRVISIQDYLAYEVSTPELDDVIRLQDDSGRKSGRIDSEHKK